ncbi:MAG TPA: VCBS repeat-containing protein [Thermoanaerobaculia bacterium]|nr:VCBS repeat-containing protein [Thermoanaerobaculia bacterium]
MRFGRENSKQRPLIPAGATLTIFGPADTLRRRMPKDHRVPLTSDFYARRNAFACSVRLGVASIVTLAVLGFACSKPQEREVTDTVSSSQPRRDLRSQQRGLGPEFGVYSESEHAFHLRRFDGTEIVIVYGREGDIPLHGDWSGDGVTRVGVYRPVDQTFHLLDKLATGSTEKTVQFGKSGDIPLVGDWDADGRDSIGVYRPSESAFYLKNRNRAGAPEIGLTFGSANGGYIPLAGDFDGDGKTTVGLYLPATSQFFLRNKLTAGIADVQFEYGSAGTRYIPIMDDWNGDGTDTPGLYAPELSTFLLRNSNNTGVADSTIVFPGKGIPLSGSWQLD